MKVENSLVKIEDRGDVVDVTFKDLPFGCRTLTRVGFDALAEAISMCKNSAPERGPITIEHQRFMRLSLKADLAQLELLNKALHGAQVPHNKVLVIGEIKQALGLPVNDDAPAMAEQGNDDALVQACLRLWRTPGAPDDSMRAIIAIVREQHR